MSFSGPATDQYARVHHAQRIYVHLDRCFILDIGLLSRLFITALRMPEEMAKEDDRRGASSTTAACLPLVVIQSSSGGLTAWDT